MSTAREQLRPTSTPSLSRRLAGIAQIAWFVLLCLVLYVLVLRIRLYLHQVHTICTQPNCQGAQVTTSQVRLLHTLGLSLDGYAIYVSGVQVAFFAVYAAVGAIIIRFRSRDRLAVFSALTLLLFGGLTIGDSGEGQSGLGLPIALQGPVALMSLLGSYGMVLFFYFFPSGRLVVRWPAILLIGWAALQVQQYLGGDTGAAPASGPLAAVAWVAALGSVIYVQIYRYRSVSNGPERQQTKWIVYGLTVALAGFLTSFLLFSLPAVTASPLAPLYTPLAFFGFLALIPISIGLALLRYRLWDVDVVINRTLVYGLLTALLASLYAGGVVLLQALFRALAGQGSELAVAISTLAIAALFQPLRRGIQAFIDRRFYRRKYDAAQALATFGVRMRDDIDIDGVREDILSMVRETVEPSHVSLWLR